MTITTGAKVIAAYFLGKIEKIAGAHGYDIDTEITGVVLRIGDAAIDEPAIAAAIQAIREKIGPRDDDKAPWIRGVDHTIGLVERQLGMAPSPRSAKAFAEQEAWSARMGLSAGTPVVGASLQ